MSLRILKSIFLLSACSCAHAGESADQIRAVIASPQRLQVSRLSDIRALAFNADASLLAVGLDDGRVKIVDTRDYRVTKKITCAPSPIRSLAFRPEGNSFIASSYSLVREWSVDGPAPGHYVKNALVRGHGRCTQRFHAPHWMVAHQESMSFVDDTIFLNADIQVDSGSTIGLYNAQTEVEFELHDESFINTICRSKNGLFWAYAAIRDYNLSGHVAGNDLFLGQDLTMDRPLKIPFIGRRIERIALNDDGSLCALEVVDVETESRTIEVRKTVDDSELLCSIPLLKKLGALALAGNERVAYAADRCVYTFDWSVVNDFAHLFAARRDGEGMFSLNTPLAMRLLLSLMAKHRQPTESLADVLNRLQELYPRVAHIVRRVKF